MKNLKQPSISLDLSKMLFLLILLSNAGFLLAQNLSQPPELIPYHKNGKWGFCDKNNTVVIECKYDAVLPFTEGLSAVLLNGKWGYIDKTGKEVISIKYEGARGFSEGLAAVKLNGKWGYIDKTGRIVIQPKYDGTWFFSEGLAVVQLNGELGELDAKFGYIDKAGKEVIPTKYNAAFSFSEGLAVVRVGDVLGKYGYIDKTGKEVISPKYDNALRFSNGSALVELNNKWGYIDANGNENWEVSPSNRNIFNVINYGRCVGEFRVKFNILTIYNIAKYEQINDFISSNKDFFYNIGIASIDSKGDVINLQNLLNEKLKVFGFIIETSGKFGVETYIALDILIKIKKLGLENVKSVKELERELNKKLREQGKQDTLKTNGMFTSKVIEIIDELIKTGNENKN